MLFKIVILYLISPSNFDKMLTCFSSKKATLVINLVEENVSPGSVLTGKVYMNVVVEKMDAESLMIRLCISILLSEIKLAPKSYDI